MTTAEKRNPVQQSCVVTGTPFYYGWVIAAVGILARIMSSPGQTYATSVFIEHFIRDLGISRSMVSTLYTVGTLTASLALPMVGRQVDKRGPRLVMSLVVAGLALACFYMASIQGAIMLGIGFFLLRMLGQGSLGMVSGTVVNNWWVRRRGSVLGASTVISSLLGNGLAPAFILMLITRFGWRTSYPIMGAMLLAILLPVTLIFVRRRPEDFGLEPDGRKVEAQTVAEATDEPIEENWTRDEALRTSAFWILGAGLASIAMLSTGLQFHMVSVFADSGLSETAAAAVFLPISATIAIVALSSGLLIDRIPARYFLFVALVGQTVTLLMAPRLPGATTATIYGVVLGITGGLQQTVQQVVWPNYFGRKHLGAIMGVSSFVIIAGSALGPMPMGVARDLAGSYTAALTWLAVLPAALAILALFARRPRKS